MGVILEHPQVPRCHQYNPSLEKALVLGPYSLLHNGSPLSSVVCRCQPLGSFSPYRTNSFEDERNSFVSCWRACDSLSPHAFLRLLQNPSRCLSPAGSSALFSPPHQLSFTGTMTTGLNGANCFGVGGLCFFFPLCAGTTNSEMPLSWQPFVVHLWPRRRTLMDADSLGLLSLPASRTRWTARYWSPCCYSPWIALVGEVEVDAPVQRVHEHISYILLVTQIKKGGLRTFKSSTDGRAWSTGIFAHKWMPWTLRGHVTRSLKMCTFVVYVKRISCTRCVLQPWKKKACQLHLDEMLQKKL